MPEKRVNSSLSMHFTTASVFCLCALPIVHRVPRRCPGLFLVSVQPMAWVGLLCRSQAFSRVEHSGFPLSLCRCCRRAQTCRR